MKNLKRGDRVRFLNDTGSGIITRILDNEMVMVRTDEGFEYPVMRSELLLLATSSYDEISQDQTGSDHQSEEDNKVVKDELIRIVDDGVTEEEGRFENIFMAVVPNDLNEPVGGEIDVYLINDSNYNLIFHGAVRRKIKDYKTIAHGYLEPETKYLLGNFHMDDIFSKTAGIRINLIPFREGLYEHQQAVDFFYNPEEKILKTIESYMVNDYTEGNAILVNIINNIISRQSSDTAKLKAVLLAKDIIIKDKIQPLEDLPKMNTKNNPEEVDLHINEIIENTEDLSSGKIVEIQIARFKTALDGAILNKQKKIIFIHGMGAGKLKHEIRKIIDRDYPRCRYQDASFKEYGYGATMVLTGKL